MSQINTNSVIIKTTIIMVFIIVIFIIKNCCELNIYFTI